ncbi:MAG: hypothetical protein H6888_06255 [Nitratireductor sp.]|nr:hypothetical protein [Nitratireductor sp.]MCC0020663.1 hypothetical protein [Nitratireductor sp.]
MKPFSGEIELERILEAQQQACEPRVSDEQLAREYALMMEQTYLDAECLAPDICPPTRRLFKGDKEAWVYEHGNIAELVFVTRD